jgi:hypothetical protein
MKNRLATLAGALALMAVLGKFYAVPAIAQIRAALVKNVDEKGRAPYQQSGFVQCTAGNSFCDLSTAAVPANKRLIVEHVTANVFAPSGVNGVFLIVGGNTTSSLLARSNGTASLMAVNETVLMFYEAGASPLFRLVPSTTDGSASYQATITGYLVDLTQ